MKIHLYYDLRLTDYFDLCEDVVVSVTDRDSRTDSNSDPLTHEIHPSQPTPYETNIKRRIHLLFIPNYPLPSIFSSILQKKNSKKAIHTTSTNPSSNQQQQK